MKYIVADIAPIKHSERYYNEAGYLVLPKCKIACSGVLRYGDVKGQDGEVIAGGEIINVLRPASVLKKCVKQFSNLPVTLEHPASADVNPDNARGLTVGTLGSNPEYIVEDGVLYIINDIIIYDKEAQKKIESDEFAELSAGYSTAFRQARGTCQDGTTYEAEQFILEPNHVALVENGRCGSKCRVCDEEENQSKKGEEMAKTKKTKSRCRYFLQVSDSSEEMVELTEEQFDQMQAENPELEVEELDEEEVAIEEDLDVDVDEDEVEVPGTEEVEDEEDLDVDVDEDEVEVPGTEEVEDEEDDFNGTVLTVRFEDGTVGKMDEVAYEHCKRYMEMSKKSDSAEKKQSFASTLVLTQDAKEILGNKFDLKKFVVGDSINTNAIKRNIIKAVMPEVEFKGLVGDSLDRICNMAIRTHRTNVKDHAKDLAELNLAPLTTACDEDVAEDMVSKARRNYQNRNAGKKGE